MDFESKKIRMQDLWNLIDEKNAEKISNTDTSICGIKNIEKIIFKLKQLEKKSLAKNDPFFFNQIHLSIDRANEVKKNLKMELLEKN